MTFVDDYNISPVGEKTTDWEWRTNLKEYDVIDCFDRSKWYPSTIMKTIDDSLNEIKYVRYKVGFRLYPEHFKNPEDEKDTYDKHTDIWNHGCFSANINMDSKNEKYIGDQEGFDEIIDCSSKRIQKFNTFSKCQQKYLNYSYSGSYYRNNEVNNPMKIMNEKLENDNEISIDNLFYYELNGKKNCIIGKNKEFHIYYAILLKNLEKEDFFTKIIEILQNNPNVEEMYNIFYILLNSFQYIHKDFFKENCNIIKNSLIQ